MEIIGKFKNKLVIKCDAGHHYEFNTFRTSSGCFLWTWKTTYFDYIELNKFTEIDDNNIINEIISKRPDYKKL